MYMYLKPFNCYTSLNTEDFLIYVWFYSWIVLYLDDSNVTLSINNIFSKNMHKPEQDIVQKTQCCHLLKTLREISVNTGEREIYQKHWSFPE